MKTALIILDGFGISKISNGNAVKNASTPYFDSLCKLYPYTILSASGKSVGLPDGMMGNSEVGHLTIGSGRILYQDLSKINNEIESGNFFSNSAFLDAIDNAKKHNSALHLVGLTSDGGVHSSISHLAALLKMASDHKLKNVFIHCITDGRDVGQQSAVKYIDFVQSKIDEYGVGRIATVVGRFYYMDRDKRFDRLVKGYNMISTATGEHYSDAYSIISENYKKGIYDEFIEPSIIGNYPGLKDNDSIIFYNFRTDRAREITEAITEPVYNNFDRKGGFKKTFYVCMTQYDKNLKNVVIAFPPKDIKDTLGEVVSNAGLSQVRLAETEKYAHVTFFFNGGVEAPNPNETRILVASPKVPTYDLQPEMSAFEVTEKALEVVNSNTDLLIINYANVDMVGHTGNYSATVKAVETVDACLKKLVGALLANNASALIIADHGNGEKMLNTDGSVCTSHTNNPVPCILVGKQFINKELITGGELKDVAPTILDIIDVPVPSAMEGKSLIKESL